MENQHQKITGYRDLSQAEIDLMNEVKALGPQIDAVITKVQTHVGEQRKAAANVPDEHARLENATPERWAAMAKSDFQTALMKLTRAIAQPGFF